MYWIVFTSLSLACWIYLLSFRGQFWRADQRLRQPAAAHAKSSQSATERVSDKTSRRPSVAVVIPARNEADTIAPVISSHLASAYDGAMSVTLLDDQSSDETRALAERAAQDNAPATRDFQIITGAGLPDGWSGKLWALSQGVAAADSAFGKADFLLLTDADIVHAPGALGALVTKAQQDSLALASLMARLDNRGGWGRLLIPAFIYFFQKLYPFRTSNDLYTPVAAAAGGCMLIRRSAYDAAGGVEAIRDQLIDDCAMARLLKGDSQRRIWLGLAEREVVSLRDNRSLASVWKMVARTAFTQLDHAWLQLIGTVGAMAVIYLVPPLSLLAWPLHDNQTAAMVGAGAFLLMLASYLPTLRLYDQSRLDAFGLPIAAFFYTLMTISSALQHARGRGGAWKGRTYS